MSENLFLRPADLQYVKDALAEGACCSIVGLSNIGKSMLLRTAAEDSSTKVLNIYVDCNLMPALTDQSFYEVTLRAVLDAVKRLGKKAPLDVVNRLETLCRQVAIIDHGRIIERDDMASVLRKLHAETFVLSLREPVAAPPRVPGYEVICNNAHEIEVEVTKDRDLNEVFAALSAAGLHVISMRNKAKRLSTGDRSTRTSRSAPRG